ncbi:cation-translocating P-type ATPase [Candidatus Parcubacteria bacterium]|nr:cation-translocating P-type ATPase [Patescibacteria group bacterium]MCG2688802.1 cation-translocating P-type ATPase [Candidatus Parcubacteria bacterium]
MYHKNFGNNEASRRPWHALTAATAIAELKTDGTAGLSDVEAQTRLQQYGPNQLIAAAQISPLVLFLHQFKNSLIIILLVATALSGILGHAAEAIAIGVIILFAVVLGFVQEWRAERALEALRKLASPIALVFRDGLEREVPAQELVLGDIIVLATGDRFPADARLIEAMNLKAEEAALTGESVPVEKHSELTCAEDAALGDRRNIVFAGTSAVYGRGRAVVTAIGMQTEFGRIAGMLQSVKQEKTPLEKNLDRVAKTLTKAAFVVVAGIVLLGLFREQPLLEMIVFGIALAVAVVPEALPAVVTISLAIGVQRMVKRNVLVRHLPAVETLGCVSIICSDKTGTLTKDEMTVRKIFLDGEIVLEVSGSGYEPKGEFLLKGQSYPLTDSLRLLLQATVLSSDARLAKTDGVWDLKGDPTEGALVVAAAKAGLQKEFLDERFRRMAEIPFSSESKRMTTLHQSPEGTVAYGKGAAEIILTSCTRYQGSKGTQLLTEEVRAAILAAIETFGEEALRVIGVAYVPATDFEPREKQGSRRRRGSYIELAQHDMIFLGLFGMIDPPRPEAKLAIELCRQAGIQLMMITGDHPVTAEAIARELNLLPPGSRVITGSDLSAMSDNELEQSIENIAVCARVSPEHKLRVVEALQRRGHIVAMTGDGVNDAPAIKKANIGIAMGITGTDVSREAAAMTLTDDNFASIVAAVEEGRIIFGNIKKYLMFLLSSNIGEIGLIVVTSIFGLPLPLSAVQILYVNLATDGLPALALAVDPPEANVMRRSSRKLTGGIFSRSVVTLMVTGGVWSALVNVGLFVWALQSGRGLIASMTMVFVSLVLIQFFKAYSFRSDHYSVLHRPFANQWLNRAILWELLLLALVIYVPFLQAPFKTVALSYADWAIVAGAAATVVPILEITKGLLRRRETSNEKKRL